MQSIDNLFSDAISLCSETLKYENKETRLQLPIDKQTTAQLLTDAYIAQTKARRAEFIKDEVTLNRLENVAEWLTNRARKPSLMLYGETPGTGKTTTALAIRRMAKNLKAAYSRNGIQKLQKKYETFFDSNIISRFEQMADAVRVPYYITALEISTMALNDRKSYDSIVSCPYLIVDDIGTEPISVKEYGNEVLPITELIYKRYDEMLPTVITTNLNLSAVSERYGLRVYDRVIEMCEMIPFVGKSHRK